MQQPSTGQKWPTRVYHLSRRMHKQLIDSDFILNYFIRVQIKDVAVDQQFVCGNEFCFGVNIDFIYWLKVTHSSAVGYQEKAKIAKLREKKKKQKTMHENWVDFWSLNNNRKQILSTDVDNLLIALPCADICTIHLYYYIISIMSLHYYFISHRFCLWIGSPCCSSSNSFHKIRKFIGQRRHQQEMPQFPHSNFYCEWERERAR